MDVLLAGGISVGSLNPLGFPDGMFSIGAPGDSSESFAKAFENEIRENSRETADPGKTCGPCVALSHFEPHPVEGNSSFKGLQCGDVVPQQTIVLGAEMGAQQSLISGGDVMMPVVTGFDGGADELLSSAVVDGVDLATSDALSPQQMLPKVVPRAGPFLDEVGLPKQAVAAESATTVGLTEGTLMPESDEMAIAGFLREIPQPNEGQIFGQTKAGLLDGETGLQGFPGIFAKNGGTIDGGPGFQRVTAFSEDNAPVEQDEVLLFRAEPAPPGQGEKLPSVAKLVLPTEKMTSLAGSFGGEIDTEEAADFVAASLPKLPLGGGVLEISPEQPVQTTAPSVLEIGHSQLFDQLVQGVRMAQNNEATEILVNLKPHFLGQLSIRALADDHGMHIEIKAENEVVRQVMQDNLANLQQWLAEKGLEFSQLNILADTDWHSHQEPKWSAEGLPISPETEMEITGETVPEPLSHIRTGMIDYLA